MLAQVALTGVDALAIAWRTALLHALLGGLLMFFFMRTLVACGAALPGAAGVAWAAWAVAALLGPSLVRALWPYAVLVALRPCALYQALGGAVVMLLAGR